MNYDESQMPPTAEQENFLREYGAFCLNETRADAENKIGILKASPFARRNHDPQMMWVKIKYAFARRIKNAPDCDFSKNIFERTDGYYARDWELENLYRKFLLDNGKKGSDILLASLILPYAEAKRAEELKQLKPQIAAAGIALTAIFVAALFCEPLFIFLLGVAAFFAIIFTAKFLKWLLFPRI